MYRRKSREVVLEQRRYMTPVLLLKRGRLVYDLFRNVVRKFLGDSLTSLSVPRAATSYVNRGSCASLIATDL